MASISIAEDHAEHVRIGELRARWSARGDRILRYSIDFVHEELGVHKEVSAPDIDILQNKVDTLLSGWHERHLKDLEKKKIELEASSIEAASMEASARLERLETILERAVGAKNKVDWEALKDRAEPPAAKEFPVPKPVLERLPRPVYEAPETSFWMLLTGRARQAKREAEERFEQALEKHKQAESARQEQHKHQMEEWRQQRSEHFAGEEAQKAEFLRRRDLQHEKIDALRENYLSGDVASIIEHAGIVLEGSCYDSLFEKSFIVDYEEDSKTLLLEYDLPSMDDIPTLKSLRFIKSTGEIRESHVSDRVRRSNFDSVCYQVCLRTVHEIFEADEIGAVDSVLFNGFATHVDPRTGNEVRSCLMSVLVNKETFSEYDLARVDPKACFKSLKGVSGARLSALAAIAPVMELDRSDDRFVDSKETIGDLDESINLAAMDWEDFEHLVREIFEKEFIARGGDVRVTRSSRDGGVDAVAFDPDPITGGKIVIQAKRYTRTVGVSAVRDLYGTTLNEGASKGILVTTADYGPDAYKFASDKPITLLTGANLLHMLEKHGVRAKIDLKEAREASA